MQNKIAEIREKKKLSRAELAELIGIDRTHLYKIETNKANPSLSVLERLSEKLNVPIKKFF